MLCYFSIFSSVNELSSSSKSLKIPSVTMTVLSVTSIISNPSCFCHSSYARCGPMTNSAVESASASVSSFVITVAEIIPLSAG